MKDQEATVNIADIHVIKQAIEVATQRGAFRADEMSTIGPAYDKISNWISSDMEKDQADSDGETDAETHR